MIKVAKNNSLRPGLTLMEVVISSLLVGTVLITSLSTTAAWRRLHQQTGEREITRRLADELVSEITSNAFIDPTWTAPSTFGRETSEIIADRSNWNDVDDYHGLSETTIRDKSGAAISTAAGYTRAATISAAVASTNAPGYTVSNDVTSPLRLITVTVVAPSGQTVVVTGLKSNVATEFSSAFRYARSITIDMNDNGSHSVRTVGTLNHPATP